MSPHPEPLTGGESARVVLDVLRSFPLTCSPTGATVVHNTAIGDAAAVFARAYERMSVTVSGENARCPAAGSHGTLHPEDYRYMVLSAMADDAKKALGETARIDAAWLANRDGHGGHVDDVADWPAGGGAKG